MEKADLIKEVKGINTFSNVVNTKFTEFITDVVIEEQPPITVENFFSYYDQLFYDIPINGINSHSTLIEKSTQYIGGSVIDEEKQALIEEINSLKQQIIDIASTFSQIDQFAV